MTVSNGHGTTHHSSTRIASDPINNHEWRHRELDEPWCFLAAAIEYKACVIDSTKPTSGLPIGIDATCSGLQHLSAMTLCGHHSCPGQRQSDRQTR